jgi:hypothetical protein
MHRENRRRECESTADILPMPIVIEDGTATAVASSVVETTNPPEKLAQRSGRPAEGA